MKLIVSVVAALSVLFGAGSVAEANTVASSTLWFEGSLAGSPGGPFTGDLNMVDESVTGVGDGVAGFDIYGREGALAWFGDNPGSGPVWTSQLISGHDAWPTWLPDTPDWYQYSVSFYNEAGVSKWALRNHPGSTAANPHTTAARGVPMSGLMDWVTGRALETGLGAYLQGTGTPEIPGGAAGHGGGAACWDMDWSWGTEVVPLEYGAFQVALTDLGSGRYRMSMTPVPEPGALALLGVGLGALALLRRRARG